MYFFTLYGCVFLFVQKPYGRKGAVVLQDKDIFHAGGITQGNALFCEAAVHFVFHPVDDNHTVGGNAALQFQKEALFNLAGLQTADFFRFGKEPVLRGFPL